MSEASRQLLAGRQGPLWIIADRQLQGRGRHGRNWASPDGNLHATLLLTTGIGSGVAPEIGFVAGLALYDAVSRLTGLASPRLALKWPNDVLIDRAKCAGLLLEGVSQGSTFALSIGFGVNVITAPDDMPYASTSLARHVPGLSRDELMLELANCFAARLSLWQEGRIDGTGFASTRESWRQRSAFLGETVTLRLPGGPVTGQFEDIDASGRLVLLTGEGRRIIDAGDLFFGTASA